MKTILNLFMVAVFPMIPNADYTYPHFCTKKDPEFKEIRYTNVAVCGRIVLDSTKKEVYKKYEIPDSEIVNYTIDHLVPLSLGGSNSAKNLWPQHKSISSSKLEFETYEKLRKNAISHQEAINIVLDFKFSKKQPTN